MKERRGPISRVSGMAEGVAAGARRRQREREPRAMVYDVGGHPQVVPPASPAHEPMVAAAQAMLGALDQE